jgi:hypothetical protein
MTPLQAEGLAFGIRECRVASARVNTFQVGAASSGMILAGGLTRSLGPNWGAFGGLGTINQTSVNQFRTDVQVKLEELDGSQRAFLQTALPFEITLSIDPGETLAIFFARGGLAKPVVYGDFYLSDWTPFAAQDLDTGQIVPISPLPSLMPRKVGGIGCGVALLAYGCLAALVSLVLMTDKRTVGIAFAGIVVHTVLFVLPGLALAFFRPSSIRTEWRRDFDAAKALAANSTV